MSMGFGKKAVFFAALWLSGSAALSGAEGLGTQSEPDGGAITLTTPVEPLKGWCFIPVEAAMKRPADGRPAEWRVTLTSFYNFMGGSLRGTADFTTRGAESRARALLVACGERGSGVSYGMNRTVTIDRSGGGTGFGSSSSSGSPRSPAVLYTTGAGSANAMDPAEAPDDWRAYAGYARMVVTDADWNRMTPGAQTAVRQWVRLGGSLQVKGADTESDVEENWFLRANEGRTETDWGNRAPDLFEKQSNTAVSFLMVAVVVVFAILVGPVNLFVFAPARRRHRLFYTTPLISLVAGGVLVGAVLVGDGIGGKGRRYVWLDSSPDDNTSYVVQHQHSRCGLMLGAGFSVPEAAYFAPVASLSDMGTGGYVVSVEGDRVNASGPWFSSRRSQSFLLAAARPGRGRMELGGTAEQPKLTSAFDFPLDQCFWLAPDGRTWWKCGNISQGSAVELAPSSADEMKAALEGFLSEAPQEYDKALDRAVKSPGHFIALASRVPAIETHRGVRWDTRGIVTGPAATP